MIHIIITFPYLALLAPFISANIIQQRSADELFPYICFERDNPPVEIVMRFEENCYDIQGNKYHENATLHSCCDCFIYTCILSGHHLNVNLFSWVGSVSDRCCQHCDGVVYKPDSVMETIQIEDKCQTVETSVCRILPDHENAVVETEYNYKQCCYDEDGKVPLNSTKYEPGSCSQRVCHYSQSLRFSVWISSQITEGCDCCLVNGKLKKDKETWVQNDQTYECCRGDIAIKLDNIGALWVDTTTSSASAASGFGLNLN